MAKKKIISKGDEMTGSRTKLHFEKMRILYPLPNIRTIRTKETELDESSSTNERDAYVFWLENLKKRDYIRKYTFNLYKCGGRRGLNL
jgi:hypothetical protein